MFQAAPTSRHGDEVGGAAHDEGCRSAKDATVNCKQGLHPHVVALDPSELCHLPLDWREYLGRAAGEVGDALLSDFAARACAASGRAAPPASLTMKSRRRILDLSLVQAEPIAGAIWEPEKSGLLVVVVFAAPLGSGHSPRLPSWSVRQVGGYLGYTGRAANVVARAAHDP